MYDVTTLKKTFAAMYPESREPFVCRAPGRVNIIGEHTDYNGLSVLPMTIDRDIWIVAAPRADHVVRMRDTDASFPPRQFVNEVAIPPSEASSWENYCKAAIEGLNQHFRIRRFFGMDLLVSGTIPMSAGLSSSSALVVACALAYLRCLGKRLGEDISRLDLAVLLAEAEHYVGTRGGGMDQAIILLGDEGMACKIDFFPMRIERVPLPNDHALVVCNSLIRAEKTGDALHRYNAGPRLCRLVCALVARQARDEFGEEVEIERLGDLWSGHLCLTDNEVAALFEKTFPRETATLAEAARTLHISPEEIRARWLGDLKEPDEGFRLKSRARHQLTEYQRVEAARDCLLSGEAAYIGTLMNQSHASCANDYEVSCPELDALVIIAREAGAIGARLTGAGFGGCTVNLVPAKRLAHFYAQVEQRYYRDYLAGRNSARPPKTIFTARATAPADYL
jgi:N-acetylgalactosamine kinase